jgi:endonuclease/exonuclease/phosphatase (EEP) superfamily protein YafD
MNLRVLFWNVRGGSSAADNAAIQLVPAIIEQLNLDIVTLAEAPEDTQQVLRGLGVDARTPSPSLDRNDRRLVTLVVSSRFDVTTRVYDRHHRAYAVAPAAHEPVTLVTVHLQSPTNDKGTSERARMRANRCYSFVDDVERAAGHKRSIVYGDFNMDPFSTAMVHIEGLNAMNTSARARHPRSCEHVTRATFYNPMWNLLGDRRGPPHDWPSPAGTFYMDDDGPAGYFWRMPDQVLVRGELAEHLGALEILNAVGPHRLISERAHQPCVSDHLPVLFELRETAWRQRHDS